MKTNIQSDKISREWLLIIFFVIVKLLIHFFTYNNYELHRDTYLYYAQSENLAWGFVAVPPSIAFVGKIATSIFGNTTFALRFFPAVIGALNLIIIGLMVKELNGKKAAITLASLAYILSPSYLHVNALFQPVSFNQFYWLLSGYLVLLMIKRNEPKYWIWIAVVFGLAFLNKYSIVFFYFAFAISLIISEYRRLYFSKYFLIALAVGLSIILPNIIWQHLNNWPVLYHMAELRETQLVHMQLMDFVSEQFLMNIQGLWLWLPALFLLLFYKKEKEYRLFAFIYLGVIILLILGSGKSYYSLGVYPILFVFGAYLFEKYIKRHFTLIFSLLLILLFTTFYISLSYNGIPFYTFEKVVNKDAFRWEDGTKHDVPQDMADMTGWKDLGQRVTEVYLSLTAEQRNNCEIFCEHYGQAGAVMFYGKERNVVQPISFNGSFVFWAPDSLTKDYMIWVKFDDENNSDYDLKIKNYFKDVELKATINNKFFRENGTKIYLGHYPTELLKNIYRKRISELKNNYR